MKSRCLILREDCSVNFAAVVAVFTYFVDYYKSVFDIGSFSVLESGLISVSGLAIFCSS